jgi:lysophospholipase L1-like esterase
MKRLALALAAVIGMASLAANILLFESGQQYYSDLNAARLDPLGLSYFRDGPPPPVGGVVFFGDSRAASWPAPAESDLVFVNRGIGAQTTAQIAGRFDAHIAPLKPQVVILQAGVNDLKAIPLFPVQKQAIIANCKANLREMIDRSRTLGATVIVTTIFPVGEVPLIRRPFWSADVAPAVEDVNAFLRSLAGERVIVFDAYAVLQDGGTVRAEYALDELHLNDAGYAALNTELSRVLAELK